MLFRPNDELAHRFYGTSDKSVRFLTQISDSMLNVIFVSSIMDDFDIVDLILEKLAPADDEWERLGYDPVKPKADLASCSLVCRLWYEVSRRHLFRSVLYSFTSEEDVPGPESLHLAQEGKWELFRSQQNVDNPSVMKPRKTLPKLIQFLRDRPKLASSIRQLSLRGFPHSWTCPNGPEIGWPGWYAYRDHTKFVPPWLVIALLQILPDLHTLRLRDIFLCIDSNSDMAITSKPFDHSLVSLDQLSISYPLAKSCKQGHRLLQLLNRCVSARTLQVSVPDGDRVIMTDGHLSQIDTLVLFEVPYETGLPRHLLGLNVRSLTLVSAKASDIPAYDRCFREVGRTLQELYIVQYNARGQYLRVSGFRILLMYIRRTRDVRVRHLAVRQPREATYRGHALSGLAERGRPRHRVAHAPCARFVQVEAIA